MNMERDLWIWVPEHITHIQSAEDTWDDFNIIQRPMNMKSDLWICTETYEHVCVCLRGRGEKNWVSDKIKHTQRAEWVFGTFRWLQYHTKHMGWLQYHKLSIWQNQTHAKSRKCLQHFVCYFPKTQLSTFAYLSSRVMSYSLWSLFIFIGLFRLWHPVSLYDI